MTVKLVRRIRARGNQPGAARRGYTVARNTSDSLTSLPCVQVAGATAELAPELPQLQPKLGGPKFRATAVGIIRRRKPVEDRDRAGVGRLLKQL